MAKASYMVPPMAHMEDGVAALEAGIGYRFADGSLLARALTRKAHALEQSQQGVPVDDQEVLRILGDAVLRVVLVDLLMGVGRDSRASISLGKSTLENEERLSQLARGLGIGTLLLLGKGERMQGAADNAYVLAESLEALFGAVYLDGGFYAAKDVISGLYAPLL